MIHESWAARLNRYRHLLKHFVLYRLVFRSWQKSVRQSRGKFRGQQCFVFATGPSVRRMDLDRIKSMVAEGYQVIGLNSYLSSDLANEIPPDFMVISDPAYMGKDHYAKLNFEYEKYKGEYVKDHQGIRSRTSAKLVLPHHWHRKVSAEMLFPDHEILYFNHSENIRGRPNGCDLVRPRYYIAMTAYIGVALAVHLGFSEIYLMGFDEDYVRELEIDIRNHVIWHDRHFYAETEERCTRDMTVEAGLTYESYAMNIVRACISQKRLNDDAASAGARVFNCNPRSFVVGFPKTDQFVRGTGT